jgi:hypothetical protein
MPLKFQPLTNICWNKYHNLNNQEGFMFTFLYCDSLQLWLLHVFRYFKVKQQFITNSEKIMALKWLVISSKKIMHLWASISLICQHVAHFNTNSVPMWLIALWNYYAWNPNKWNRGKPPLLISGSLTPYWIRTQQWRNCCKLCCVFFPPLKVGQCDEDECNC